MIFFQVKVIQKEYDNKKEVGYKFLPAEQKWDFKSTINITIVGTLVGVIAIQL